MELEKHITFLRDRYEALKAGKYWKVNSGIEMESDAIDRLHGDINEWMGNDAKMPSLSFL